jgi:hypothetical protein
MSKKRNDLEEEIANMPVGLDRSLLRVLSYHVGRENAIGRFDLLAKVKHMGIVNTTERQLRLAIHELRRAGHLICSAPGSKGGYYMAATLKEFDEFDQTEIRARITDLSETGAAMRRSAAAQFGQGTQLGLL